MLTLIAQGAHGGAPNVAGPNAPDKPVNIYQFNKAIWQNSAGEPLSGRYKLDTPGEIISAVYPYLFSVAGIILFAMLVWGAFEIMMGAASSKSADSGKKRITTAIIGFLLLFFSYWIGQLIQYIFGLNFGLPGST